MFRSSRALIALLFAFALAAPAAAQPITVTNLAAARAEWTHPAPASVKRFERRIDRGVWQDISLATKVGEVYRQALPLTLIDGEHTFEVRACNASGCSPELSAVFWVETAPPKPPATLTIIVELATGQQLRLRVPVEEVKP